MKSINLMSMNLFAIRSLIPRKACHPCLIWCGDVVFSNGGRRQGSVIIGSDGTIAKCIPGQSSQDAKHLADSKNLTFRDLGAGTVLSPGLIDVHTHISELGRNWEGYYTATRAAAAGGITTLMGMPLNSLPPTTTLEAVDMELEAVSKYSLMADVGLWGGAVPGNLKLQGQELDQLLESPAIFGLKAFLAPLPESAGYEAITPEQLRKAASICGRHGKPILVHSELMTTEESERAVEDSFTEHGSISSYQAHLQSRPPQWERDAVDVVCSMIDVCDMHIVHLSDAGCLERIANAKSRSSKHRLTVETCPHYLLFSSDEIPDGDTRYKCFPPIRSSENRNKLIHDGLLAGVVDMVASDHSPCEPFMRMREERDMKHAWGGLSGLQYQLSATYQSIPDIDLLAKWWSANPSALVPGLSSCKGSIAEGKQADLCAWDPSHSGPPNEYCQERHRWSSGDTLYAEMPLKGRVVGTWLAGHHIYDGETDSFPIETEPIGSILLCIR